MRIARYDSINYTPAVILATKGWLEANVAGYGEPCASIHFEQKGIVAFVGELPVGVITWTHQPSLKAVYAEQIYVLPEHRRRGVMKAMWRDLAQQARELFVPHIRLGTSPKNVVACEVYDKMGGDRFAVFYDFKV
jgi:GNAT superfamily N-acetyltransferase